MDLSALFSELPLAYGMCLEAAPVILSVKLGNLGSVIFQCHSFWSALSTIHIMGLLDDLVLSPLTLSPFVLHSSP